MIYQTITMFTKKIAIKLLLYIGAFVLLTYFIFMNSSAPCYIHNHYYDIGNNDCELYKDFSAKDIINSFEKKSNYTKWQASYFFYKCNNKKATPFIYLNRNSLYNKDIPPFDVLGMTMYKSFALGEGHIYVMLKEMLIDKNLDKEKEIKFHEIENFIKKYKD